LEGEAQVLRLSVTNNVGGQLATRYDVRAVPTLVLLDGNGNVVLRQAGSPRREEILTAVERLTG
jgi:thioredoxin-related protein